MSRHLKAIQIMLIIMGVLLLIPVLIPVIYMVGYLGYIKYAGEDCAKLPNGIYISRLAIYSLSRSFDLSNTVTLKDQNFNPLVSGYNAIPSGRIEDFYMTATTLYGRIVYPASPHDGFAYRADTGLVLHDDNPGLYQTLIDEAGTLIDIVPRDSSLSPNGAKGYTQTNLLYAYFQLRGLPQYKAKCPVNIFSF